MPSKPTANACSINHGPTHPNKRDAGPGAKRCGRCRQWYVPDGRGRRRA